MSQGEGIGNHSSYDMGGVHALNSLFQDVQQQNFDVKNIADVGNRLSAIQASQLPFVLGGPATGYNPISSTTDDSGPQVALYGAASHTLPPLPNLRTKSQLTNFDSVFEKMQHTLYEHPASLAAAGVGQPGAEYINDIQAQSHPLPPSHMPPASVAPMVAATPASDSRSSRSEDTPALTPPSSSTYSISPEHSPNSMHAQHTEAPGTRNGMYPSLPSGVPSSGNFFAASNATLGSQFDDQRRRYSGGRLHKAQPLRRHGDDMDTSSDGTATPKARSSRSPQKSPTQVPREKEVPPSNIDPALTGASSPGTGEVTAKSAENSEEWVQMMRTVENLRQWIAARLDRGDFEDDQDEVGEKDVMDHTPDLYPTLPVAGA